MTVVPDAAARTVPSRPPRPPALPSITGMRVFAALAVVVFHGVFVFLPTTGGEGLTSQVAPHSHGLSRALHETASFGSLGPNFFFVLSGFVLTYSYVRVLDEPVDRAAFWRARVARIVPLYLLALLVAALSRPLLGSPCITSACHDGDNPLVWLASPVLLQAWLPWAGDALNGPAWTLSAEAFFYLVFPAVVLLLSRVRSVPALAAAALAAWAATQTGPLINAAAHPNSLLLQFSPPVRLPEFVLGICVARLFTAGVGQRLSARVISTGLVMLGLVMVPVGFAVGRLGASPASVDDGLLDPMFALVIFLGAWGSVRGGARLLEHRAVVTAGEASYAVYIIHFPLWNVFRHLWFVPQDAGDPAYPAAFAAYVVVLGTVSYLLWRFVERPARVAILQRRSKAPAPLVAAVAPVPDR